MTSRDRKTTEEYGSIYTDKKNSFAAIDAISTIILCSIKITFEFIDSFG
jgi:hypothetical protein